MRRVRDNSQYRSRIRRDDVMDGVCNVLGNAFLWAPDQEVPSALITVSKSVNKIEETPVSKSLGTLSISSGLITVAVSAETS